MGILNIWILNDSGALLVARDYGLGGTMDSTLFSGFLTAMMKFSKEITSSELQSINMQKYHVQIARKEPIIFCLIHDEPDKNYNKVLLEIQKHFFGQYNLDVLSQPLLNLEIIHPFGEIVDQIVKNTHLPPSSVEYEIEEIQNILTDLSAGKVSPQEGVAKMLRQLKNTKSIERVVQALSSSAFFAKEIRVDKQFSYFLEDLNASVGVWGKKAKVFIFGIDKAGKTALAQRFHGRDNVQTVPTTALAYDQIVQDNITITTWDVPGQKPFRGSWVLWVERSDGLIFVIDAADSDARLEEARTEFFQILSRSDTEGLPLAILANKKDLPSFRGGKWISSFFHVEELHDRQVKVFETSAIGGEGIKEAFTWIITRITRKWKKELLKKP